MGRRRGCSVVACFCCCCCLLLAVFGHFQALGASMTFSKLLELFFKLWELNVVVSRLGTSLIDLVSHVAPTCFPPHFFVGVRSYAASLFCKGFRSGRAAIP